MLARNGKRCPWKAMALIDRMHTLLANDCLRAGDRARAEWHFRTRSELRRSMDEAASIFATRPVTGYV